MANQELTQLQVLAVLATDDIFFVRDNSAGIDKQVEVSALITLLPPKALDDLSDVDLTTTAPTTGDHLEFDGTNWVPGVGVTSLDDLSDVDTTTTAPVSGDVLSFTGTVWEPVTGMAPGAHESTHRKGGSDELFADMLDIDFVPANYTRTTSPPESTDIRELTSHLKGIDLALAAGITTFLGHTDTPGSYAGAGSFFVKVNAGATALVFVADPGFVLTSDSINVLADVDTTTTAPVSGDVLSFNGTDWVPASAMAPGAHASTHISAGTDEIDGDRLDIDFVPANYTRDTTPTEVTLVVELTAHLAGIDSEILTINNNFTGHTHLEADITDLTRTIVVEDEGSGVAGGPHDTLNFVGAGVTATDGTGGTATITIPGGAVTDLDGLTDVTISAPSTGQVLRKSAGDWLNATLVEADISDLTKTVIVEDEGSGVAGGPHDTINFVGAGVAATDGTGGVATITIPGGGGTFLSHTDTPGDYTGAAGQFVKVNATPDALVFAVLALGDLPAIALDDLSNVSVASPSTSDVLSFDGANWVPTAASAPGAHASTHVSGATDVIDGDVLDITFVPTNYTRDTTPGEVTSVLELTAHLAGIDTVLATAGGGVADRQRAFAGTTATTDSLTFIDVPGMSLTTKDLGSSAPGNYIILFSAIVKHQTQKEFITFQILVDGVVKATSRVTLNFSDADVDSNMVHLEASVIDGKVIKVQWHQSKGAGQNTASIIERTLVLHAVPSSSVVV